MIVKVEFYIGTDYSKEELKEEIVMLDPYANITGLKLTEIKP